MNIAFFIISNHFAGAENMVKELAEELSDEHKVTIICNDEMRPYYMGIKDVNIHFMGKFPAEKRYKLPLTYLHLTLNLHNYLKELKFDVFHLNMGASFIPYNWAGFSKKRSFIVTLHGGEVKDFTENEGLIYGYFIKPSVKKIFINAERVITPSDWQVGRLDNAYRKKLVKIPNGVDTRKFRPVKIKTTKQVVLYVGRLIDIKGVNELHQVARLLPDVEFWFAGVGPLEKTLKGSNIRYLGFIDNDKLANLYNQASFCVFPSYHEAFSLVGLEAMACGKPIVCTPKGFTEYALDGFNSLVINPKNTFSLKRAILKLSNDIKLREQLGNNARRTALQFDWSKIAEQYLEVFNEVRNEHA
jgi:glycosyltransferase involved in cell wall biosynthesis